MALSGQSSCARVCPLLDNSGQTWILAQAGLSANDPTATCTAPPLIPWIIIDSPLSPLGQAVRLCKINVVGALFAAHYLRGWSCVVFVLQRLPLCCLSPSLELFRYPYLPRTPHVSLVKDRIPQRQAVGLLVLKLATTGSRVLSSTDLNRIYLGQVSKVRLAAD